ncbi:alpha-1B adrenergic receptor [Ambystoma mexicanum]|uniref:alpha-1B adrenergic receptor n=1 Tax=Ambystoma mexicanum TaxID=8296 RepID=UPI0037E70354
MHPSPAENSSNTASLVDHATSTPGALENSSHLPGDNQTLPALQLTRATTVGLILGAFIVFAIVGNILVILSVVCHRHLRTATNYFIVNLAMADLLLSCTVLPFSAGLDVIGYWFLGRDFCNIWAAVDVLCCTASILSLCVISIDRYIGVKYSLQYPTIVTRRRAVLALLGVWVLSTVISIGPLLGWKEKDPPDERECRINQEPSYAIISSLGSFYIPLCVLLVMYCRVYVVAKRTTKNLEAGVMRECSDSVELTLRIHHRSLQGDSFSGSRSRGQAPRSSLSLRLLKFSREKKAAKTLGIVVGMFVLCWLPFFIILPLGSISPQLKPPETLFKIIFWLGYFNSCLNPIIYPCFSKEFKRAFIRILRCQCQRRRRPGAQAGRHWQRASWERSHRDSLEDCGSWRNGSQRTLGSPASSPSYLSRVTQPRADGVTPQNHWNHASSLHSPHLAGHRQGHTANIFTFQLSPEHNGYRTKGQHSDPIRGMNC